MDERDLCVASPQPRAMLIAGAILRAKVAVIPLAGTCRDTVQRPGDIMHSKERQQLVESYSREASRSPASAGRGSNKPRSLPALMLKCAACVAVATLLASLALFTLVLKTALEWRYAGSLATAHRN